MTITIPENKIIRDNESTVIPVNVTVVSNGGKKIITINKPKTMKTLSEIKQEKNEMEQKIHEAINQFLEANPDIDLSIEVQTTTINTDFGACGMDVSVKATVNL